MQTQKTKIIILSILLALLIGTSAAFAPTTSAQAGTNGQQIYFSCRNYVQYASAMDYVIIRGTNQAGQKVEWQGAAKWEYGYWNRYVTTTGWWWVGQVRVYWWVKFNNHWYSAVYDIPKQQSGSDLIYLKCGLY